MDFGGDDGGARHRRPYRGCDHACAYSGRFSCFAILPTPVALRRIDLLTEHQPAGQSTVHITRCGHGIGHDRWLFSTSRTPAGCGLTTRFAAVLRTPRRRRHCVFANVRPPDQSLGCFALNVAIPLLPSDPAVFVPAFALYFWTCAASLWEPISGSFAPGLQGSAAPIQGRFRARKLVGSECYSKRFFAGVQCPALMPLFQQQGRAARHSDRHGAAGAQALRQQIVR